MYNIKEDNLRSKTLNNVTDNFSNNNSSAEGFEDKLCHMEKIKKHILDFLSTFKNGDVLNETREEEIEKTFMDYLTDNGKKNISKEERAEMFDRFTVFWRDKNLSDASFAKWPLEYQIEAFFRTLAGEFYRLIKYDIESRNPRVQNYLEKALKTKDPSTDRSDLENISKTLGKFITDNDYSLTSLTPNQWLEIYDTLKTNKKSDAIQKVQSLKQKPQDNAAKSSALENLAKYLTVNRQLMPLSIGARFGIRKDAFTDEIDASYRAYALELAGLNPILLTHYVALPTDLVNTNVKIQPTLRKYKIAQFPKEFVERNPELNRNSEIPSVLLLKGSATNEHEQETAGGEHVLVSTEVLRDYLDKHPDIEYIAPSGAQSKTPKGMIYLEPLSDLQIRTALYNVMLAMAKYGANDTIFLQDLLSVYESSEDSQLVRKALEKLNYAPYDKVTIRRHPSDKNRNRLDTCFSLAIPYVSYDGEAHSPYIPNRNLTHFNKQQRGYTK